MLVKAFWNMLPHRFFLPGSHSRSLLKFPWNQQAKIIYGQTNFTWPGLHQVVNSHNLTHYWNFLNLTQNKRKMGQRDLPSHSNNFMHEVTPFALLKPMEISVKSVQHRDLSSTHKNILPRKNWGFTTKVKLTPHFNLLNQVNSHPEVKNTTICFDGTLQRPVFSADIYQIPHTDELTAQNQPQT